MSSGAPNPPKDQLFLTALPNGRKGRAGDLRLSLLLTPSLYDNSALPSPFDTWPDTAAKLQWTVTFLNPDHSIISAIISTPITPTIDPQSCQNPQRCLGPEVDTKLWTEIFAAVDCVKKRKGGNHLHHSWRLSHNITNLHNRHQLDRLASAYKEFSAKKRITVPPTLLKQLNNQMQPPPLFLHPEFGTNLALKFDDRSVAQANLQRLLAELPNSVANYPPVVQPRVNYAIQQLETYGGAKLSAVSLSAVYISCLKSAVKAGHPDPSVTAAITTIRGWFTPPSNFQPDYPDIDTVIDYLEMLLFHRRNSVQKQDDIPKPDFHQLLGLVHNHPAILRKLGLVFDFVVTPPPGLAGPCSVVVNLNTKLDSVTQQLARTLAVNPKYTQCTVKQDDFYANPKDPSEQLFQSGLLNLQAISSTPGATGKPRYTLVPENADGQAVKRTDQVNNAARSAEYTTSAPTAMRPHATPSPSPGAAVSTPSARTNPVTVSPAPRTVGLALFDRDRLAKLEQAIANLPPTNPDDPPPSPQDDFFADDLIVGYRVDVLYKQRFFSLCLRASTYDIYAPYHVNSPLSGTKIDSWKPVTPMELCADEGFVSFGATQSPLTPGDTTDDPAGTQTQVHQAIFTWSGWSLSVPQPKIPQMNPQPQKDQATQVKSQHFALQPCYTLPEGVKLPPLRFNTDYRIRCRLVDLAGNGAPPGLDPNNLEFFMCTAAPVAQFSRHEPIRAPQFLLTKAIDRENEPGTHIDRMVARDNDKRSERILVPPRESLRLAELSGFLTNDRLPHTAFENQQLLIDGSFPSVACAKENQWIDGDVNRPADNDGIFLGRITDDPPQNPYYPDPLANFVRVEVVQLTDDPDQSLPVDLLWLKIATKSPWPNRLPARIRLIPRDAGGDPKIEVDAYATVEDRNGAASVPTLNVNLPKGCIVVLSISSAAVEGGLAGTDQMPYPVHLFNLTQVHTGQLRKGKRTALSSLADGGELVDELASTIMASPNHPLDSPHAFVDGSLDITTPKRTMTLVHAVKQPLDPPTFAPEGNAGYLQVLRGAGKSEADVTGQLRAHWLSTGKITCYAEWTDKVDDVAKLAPGALPARSEVAFVVTGKELVPDAPFPATRFRTLNDTVLQHFPDTRAHDVTYTLIASTNFREYYPGTDNPKTGDKQYQREGTKPLKLTVLSSVRPPAPSIPYIIPAFVWADTYDRPKKIWHAGRTVVARVYVERPFLLSGDRETIGVVLFDPTSGKNPSDQNFVSRWGADPTRSITTPILQNELSEANLCEPGPQIEFCALAEGDKARVKPCHIQYSPERKLWFTDIPINTQHANAPFIRLAIVRWQPDALSGPGEARCSQVVITEFMQISPDRWVSVQKINHSTYAVAISGAFAGNPANKCLELTLYKRWYALGHDTGWRKILSSDDFVYHPATDGTGISAWSTQLQTPKSAYVAKYRILLTEQEFPGQATRKSFSMFVDLP